MAAVLLVATLAHADDPAPPPDPSRGDRYDGRDQPAKKSSAKDDALAVPRILLAPPRLLLRGAEYVTRPIAEWTERTHLPKRILRIFTSDDGQIGLRPEFSYTAGFIPIFGVTFFDHKFAGPDTDFDVTIEGADPSIVITTAHLRPTRAYRPVQAEIDANYTRRNDQLFTGIGMIDTQVNPAARYSVDAFDFGASTILTLSRSARLALGEAFGLRRYGDGRFISGDLPITELFCVRDSHGFCVPGTVDEREVPGFHAGTRFLRSAAALRVDTRDSTFRPSSGAELHLEAQYTHGVGEDESSYFRFHAGVEAALDLWRRSRVLIVRVRSDLIVPTNDVAVPFTELVVLGGHDDLRGVRPGRFRDFSSVLATLEYRWPIWMWLDGELFTDVGGVFGKWFKGFDPRQFVPDVGAGLRLRTMSQFYMRAQLAYGFNSDGFQFFIGASIEP